MSEIATANPSGHVLQADADGQRVPLLTSPPAKPTPTAMPSGKLCSVIAMMNSQMRAMRSARGSFAAEHEVLVRHEAMDREQSTGARKHAQAHQRDAERSDGVVSSSVCSSAGSSSEKNVAASITPAAALSMPSCARSLGLAQQQDAERAEPVPSPASRLPMNPSQKSGELRGHVPRHPSPRSGTKVAFGV